jgi:hypothetical protein
LRGQGAFGRTTDLHSLCMLPGVPTADTTVGLRAGTDAASFDPNMRVPAFLPIPTTTLLRAAVLLLFAAMSLLGSGGLHALAPCCPDAGCVSKADANCAHAHCGHAHPRCHAAVAHQPSEPARQPVHTPDHCLICQHAATAVTIVAVVEAPVLVEPVCELIPLSESPVWTAPLRRVCVRGPPGSARA